MNNKPKEIIIIGGGTAGWMTANSLLKAWGSDTSVTLIESKSIEIIGVGEGSTPYLKQYFSSLGIAESEWMPQCDATYKAGIDFQNWSSVQGYESYFHPFFSQLDLKSAELFFHNSGRRRRGESVNALPNHYFVSAHIASQNLSPVPNENLQLDVDYGYHFDSVKLGAFLKNKAIEQGLAHITDQVLEVKQDHNGSILSIITKDNFELTADFFIDCTGFTGVLVNKTLEREFYSYKDCLFNDSAVAIQTPIDKSKDISAQTISKALKNGWSWKIPLSTRTGNGYVYSSDFISSDNAEFELREQLNVLDEDIKVKHLKMRIGRLKKHWDKNCLAVGLSQGFIEPLEATALMLIQFTVENFISSFDKKDQIIDNTIKDYNLTLNTTFDGVRDYIVAHYKLNSRTDTEYWIACRNEIKTPVNLQNIISVWDKGLDLEQELAKQKESLIYLRPSWYCILSGMGRFPKNLQSTNTPSRVSEANLYCEQMARKYFSNHKVQLQKIYNNYM